MGDLDMEMSLLEVMQAQMGCAYLSSLRFLNDWERAQLARNLEKIQPDMAGLRDWNDALAYLAKLPPESTPEAARERLIAVLSQTGCSGCCD